MRAYDIELIGGHVLARIDHGTTLVDTGSTATIRRGANDDRAPGLFEFLGQELGCDVTALLGMGELGQRDVVFDLSASVMQLHDEAVVPAHEGLPVESLCGVPLVSGFTLGGSEYSLIFDTGAKVSYFAPELLTGEEPIGTLEDFYPRDGRIHRWRVDVYSIKIGCRGHSISVRAGSLEQIPRLLQEFGHGILGSELLQHFRVRLSMRRKRMSLEPL